MARYDGYFASGSNAPGEIAGFRTIGMNVGVAGHSVSKDTKVNRAAREELKLCTDIDVFIDTGAFGEVDGNLNIKPGHEMTPEVFGRVFDLYDDVAEAIGSGLYVVAPDRVGCQDTTLERLKANKFRMLKLRKKGVHIIVPIQKGARSMAAFDKAIAKALDFDDYIRGIPLCKDATSFDALSDFAKTLKPGTRVHLLGKGPRSRDQVARKGPNKGKTTPGYESCMSVLGHLVVTCDSVRITALSNRGTNGKNPAPLTKVQDRLRVEYDLPREPALYGPKELIIKGENNKQPALPSADSYRVKRDAIIEVLGAELREAQENEVAAAA